LDVLFAPALGPVQAGQQPTVTLFSPDYGRSDKTQAHLPSTIEMTPETGSR